MSINRNEFLETFARSTPSLKLIFINPLGAPSKLLTDVSTIELLCDKTSTQNFINYCRIHPLVSEIIRTHEFKRTNFLLVFHDGSELKFSLIKNIVRKALMCLDTDAIRKNAYVNEHGILVAAPEHHFEYNILRCQFTKEPPPERYQNYFSTFNFSIRSVIFKYMQTRFNLVYNTLEDLYVPKAKTLLTMLIGLRAEKQNTLLLMMARSIGMVFFKVFGFLLKKPARIISTTSPGKAPEFHTEKKRSTSHAV